MTTTKAYGSAAAVAIGTALFLLWAIGALGVIGTEGDRADLMYLGVLAVGIGGAIVARFRADGMVRAMAVTAAATLVVGAIALLLGKHEAEHSSVLEILALNGMFAGLFAASAWLFGRAARRQESALTAR
jgi:uncharacterized membrane protein